MDSPVCIYVLSNVPGGRQKLKRSISVDVQLYKSLPSLSLPPHYVCVCARARAYVCTNGVRGQCRVPSSITLHLSFGEKVFH